MNCGISRLRCRAKIAWRASLLTLALFWAALGPNVSAQPVPPRITQQPADRIVAVGGNTTFTVIATGDEPLAYQWYFDLLTAIPDGTNATLALTNVQPSDAGTYQVVITNAAGIFNSVEAQLTVKFPPGIGEQPASQIVTQGTSVTFTAVLTGDGPFTHQWFFNSTNPIPDATNLSLILPDAQATDAGVYSLLVTNDVGFASSSGATLEVRVPPYVLSHPTNLTVHAGTPAAFAVTADGEAPLSYQWFFNGTNGIADATNATLQIVNAQLSDAGFYSVVLSNHVGTVISADAALIVITPPEITQQPSSLTVTQGQSATFAVVASGTPTPVYQWHFNGTNQIEGATSATFTLASAQFFNAGNYSVAVSNQAGLVLSSPASLVVKVPPAILQQPAGRVVAPGGNATFSVLALGDAPLAYQWYFNATNLIADATNSSLQINNVQTATTGSYSVVVANGVGSITSFPASLALKQPPVILQQPASLSVTSGSSATFSLVAGGDGPLGYRWFFNDTNVVAGAVDAALTILNAQPANAGTYSALVTNEAGSVLSAAATLTVRVPPVVTQHPANLAVTPGSFATFTVTATGDQPLRYQWYLNTTNLLISETNSTLTLANVQQSSDGAYSATVANDVGSVSSAPGFLRVRNPVSFLQQPASLTVTQGHTATISVQIGGDSPFNYQWYFNTTNAIPNARSAVVILSNVQPANAGTYSVRVTNQVSFATSDEALLSVRLIPTITQQPASQAGAPGSNITFMVTVTGEEPFVYQWFFNQTNALPGETNSTLVRTNLQLSDAGRYSVIISNAVGSATSSNAVLALQVPPSIVAQPISLVTTQGWPASFAVTAGGDGPFGYQWYFNSVTPIPTATNSTLLLPVVQPGDAGAYSVLVTNPVGSVLSDAAMLTVKLRPTITQQPASLVVTQGQTATLSINASSEAPLSYRWRWNGTNLPGGTLPTLSLDNVQPVNTGAYDVVVQNDFGSITSSIVFLTVFGLDFGDAPDPGYPTYLTNNGARHVVVPGVYLGITADSEPDGQPNFSAAGDDLSAGLNENGVRFVTPLRPGQPAIIEVIASTTGNLNAWIDFNQSGAWNQAGEQVITNRTLLAGTNTLTLPIPSTATPGPTYARFRFSTANDLGPAGLAPDGEVEDHAMTIQPSADVLLAHTVATSRVAVGNNATFRINVTNLGPSVATDVTVVDQLPSRSTYVSATTTLGICAHTNGVVTCNLGNLDSGARATITVVARIGAGTNNLFAFVTGGEFDPNTTNNSAAVATIGILDLPPSSNTEPIILPVDDPGPGDLYPSQITVAGLTSSVFKVTVAVRDINHSFPDDIDILLVGPRGQKVLLMSDTGLDNPLVDVTVTLDDEATQPLPDGDPQIVTGTYRPTNFGTTSDDFEPPAPTAPYITNLTVFRGTDPNGTWSLYVRDDQPLNADPQGGDPGFVALGWTLSITTGDPMADLFIMQSAQPNPVIVGNHLFYTLDVTNRGPATSTAVINNPLPSGVNFVGASATRGSCAATAGIVTCDLGNLTSGAGARVILEVAPTLGGSITNLASVSGNQLELAPADNTVSVVTTVLPVADLRLSTFAAPTNALLGQAVLHSLRITNLGPNMATGVALTNILPPNVTFQSVTTPQGSCTNQGGIINCGLGNLPTGAEVLVQVSVVPNSTGISSNFTSVAAVPLDFNPTNNTAASFVIVNPSADLVLTVITPAPRLAAGRDFVTVMTISNRGPSTANVQLVDPLPAIVTFASASATRGTCSFTAGTVHCDLPGLAPGETASVTVTARTFVTGVFTNTVSLTGSVGDIDLGNNSATNIVTITPAADLVLNVSDRPDPLWLGENLAYTISVTNLGPNPAGTVSLTNALPPGINYISTSWSQGVCTRNGDEVACNLGSIPVGSFATVTITARPQSPGLYSNSAQVTSELADANPANNLFGDTTRVITSSGSFSSLAAITIPQIGPANPYPSSIFVSGLTASVFQVRVILTNFSHSYADDLDLLLVGPGGRSVLLMSDAGGDSALNSATLTFDDGAAIALPDTGFIGTGVFRAANYESSPDSFVAPAPPAPYGTNLNTFVGTDPNGLWSLYIADDADKDSGTLGGWRLTFSTLEPIADVLLAQKFSANPAAVSSNVVFTYSITNRGPAIANNVRFTNALPTLLQGVSFSTSQGACNLAGGVLICAMGNMPVGGSASVNVSGVALATGTSPNVVSVTSDLLDLQPANNSATTVMVFENPPIITLHPVSQLVTNGDSVILTGAAIGDPPLFYQWQRNGVSLVGATNAALIFSSVTPFNSGSYRFRVSNRVGTSLSEEATLTVVGPPTISDLPDQIIEEDTDTGLIFFTVQDFESPPEALTLAGDSSDPSIVPPGAFAFAGTGTNRTVRITPLPNRTGNVTIAISASDPDGGVSTNSFLLTITPINDLPAIADIPDQFGAEDVPLPVTFWVTDPETAPESLLYTVTSSNPALVADTNVVFSGAGTNRLATITPALHQYGSALLTVIITDESGATASDSFELTVTAVNDPPTLDALDAIVIGEDSGSHTVNLAGITSGAPDEIQNLTITAHSSNPAIIPNPAVTYATPSTTGSITFAPLTNSSGSVTLTVTVKDGHLTNNTFSRSFVVDVSPSNDSPAIANIADQSTNEDTPLAIAISIGDADTNSTALALTATSSQQSIVPDGNLMFSSNGANHGLTIVPATDAFGSATITDTVTDPEGASTSDSFVLTINPVNDAPILDTINDRVVAEDVPAQDVLLTGISSGPPNETQTLTFSATSSNPALVPTPTVRYTNSNPTGVLSFRPAANAVGTVVLTVTADDGQSLNQTASRSFTVMIGGTNDVPSISAIADQVTDEDAPLTVAFNINDPETAALSLSLAGVSANTNLVSSTNILFSGSGANRMVTLLPTTNQFGTSLITLRVTDGVLTNSESFLLTVNEVNDPPTLNPIAHFQTNSASGNPVYTVLLSGITDGATNETQNLTFSASSTNSALLPNPTVIYSNPDTSAAVTLRPANNSGGVALVTVTASDGGTENATFSQSFLVFIKNSANTLPTVSAIAAQNLPEDITSPALSFNVRDAETPVAAVTVLARSSNQQLLPNANIIINGTATNRNVTLTPAQNQTGTTAVTLTAVDGAFGSSNMTFNVTFTNVNDVPTISTIANQTINEDTSTGLLTFTVNDIETRSGNLTVLVSSANQTLVPNGNILLGGTGSNRGLTISPATGQTGSSSITVRVTDGVATNSTSFLVTVNSTNRPPALTAIADFATDEDTPGTSAPFIISDRETAADSLTLTATSSNPTLAPVEGITFNGTGAERTVVVTPQPNQSGTALITVKISDPGGAESTRAFTFTVHPVNDAPTLDPIASLLINENASPQSIPLTGIGSGAFTEIQALALSANSTNAGLVANVSVDYNSPAGTGTLTFLPVPNTNGIAFITVTVNDGQATNNLTPVTLIVTINAAPTVSDVPDHFTQEDTATTPIPFMVADRDTAVDELTVAGSSSNPTLVPDTGILLEGTGTNRTVTVTPAANQFGTVRINLSVTDTNGASSTNGFFLTIEPVIDSITLVTPPQGLTAVVGTTAHFSVMAESVLPLSYQWQRDGTDIAGATNPELNLPVVQLADTGDFRVLLSNADTSVTSPVARLTVVATPPNPTILSITQENGAVNISFASIAGVTYTLEHKSTLSDSDWIPSASATANSSVSILSDPEGTGPTRFYRVRAN